MAYISPEELRNASVDAGTLEKFTLGGVGEPNINRSGNNVLTLATINDRVMKLGAAQPYATLADLRVDTTAQEGAWAVVLDDPNVGNNGYYQMKGGSWKKVIMQPVGHDDLNQVVDQMNNRLPYSDSSDTHAFVDADGKIVGRIDQFSELHLVGLDGSLQRVMRREGDSTDIIRLIDIEGGILFRLDENCELYVPGLEGKSVQEAIAEKSNAQTASLGTYGQARTRRDSFTPEVTAILSNRLGSQPSAPPPLNSLPQNYSLGVQWINSLTVDEPAPMPINTAYRDNDGVVHPYLCEFYNGFRGYRYILGITGYYNTNENEENPFVFGSNDLVTFELLDGFQQPLAVRPDVPSGHNSDVFFTYDPRTGELVCCWRQSIRNSGPDGQTTMDSLWCRKTLDGYVWGEPENVFPETPRSDDIMLSPSILFDPVTFTWHMYEVKSRHIQHRTAQSLHGPWSIPVRIPVPTAVLPWHLDVRWCGDKQVMLIHDNGNGTGPDNLYFGVSEGDFLTWHIGTTPVVQNVTLGMYKATFVPVFNEVRQMAMDIIWTGDAGPGVPDMKWRLLVNRTNFVNVD